MKTPWPSAPILPRELLVVRGAEDDPAPAEVEPAEGDRPGIVEVTVVHGTLGQERAGEGAAPCSAAEAGVEHDDHELRVREPFEPGADVALQVDARREDPAVVGVVGDQVARPPVPGAAPLGAPVAGEVDRDDVVRLHEAVQLLADRLMMLRRVACSSTRRRMLRSSSRTRPIAAAIASASARANESAG